MVMNYIVPFETTRPPRRSPVLKVVAAVFASAILAVAIIAALMSSGVLPVPGFVVGLLTGAKPPEYSARYYPADALAYFWMTLVPAEGQLGDSREIFELLNEYPAFEDWLEGIKEEFEDEIGSEFDEDIRPWVGVDFSAALIDVEDDLDSAEDIEAAATIAVRDGDAASEFMTDWLEYLEDEQGVDFDRDYFGDFEIWVAEDSPQAYALSDDLLVFATSRETLEDVLERVESENTRSLAGHAGFIEARDLLPERRFMSLSLNVEDIVEDLLNELGTGSFGIGDLAITETTGLGDTPEWAAVTAGWVEKGLLIESVFPEYADSAYGSPSLADPARNLPGNTMGYLALTYDPDIDSWREDLGETSFEELTELVGSVDDFNWEMSSLAYDLDLPQPPELDQDSSMADLLDSGLWWGNQLTGIDFESDFVDYLDGELIMALSDFDLQNLLEIGAEDAVDLTAMLSFNRESADELEDTLEDIADLIEDEWGFEQESVAVGADRDATIFELPDTDYDPGFVILEKYLAIGTTENALEDLASLDNRLSDDPEYQRGLSHVPEEWGIRSYVNLQDIIEHR